MVAERAGVQRHTLYAHFPDERSLFKACSGLHIERQPLPNPESWRALADPRERLRIGLDAIYSWYERNAGLVACVLRDAEHHAITKETVETTIAPWIGALAEVLGTGLSAKQRVLLGLALSFYTWRTLVPEAGLKRNAAVAAMVHAIVNSDDA
jgi:AcrR family transcriptional regulator